MCGICGYMHLDKSKRPSEDVLKRMMAAIVHPSATESDALTTALLIEGVQGHAAFSRLRPGMKSLVVSPGTGTKLTVSTHQIKLLRNLGDLEARTLPD